MTSSAYIVVSLDGDESLMISGRSLMYIDHSDGPKIVPCGTPRLTGSFDEHSPVGLLATHADRLVRKFLVSTLVLTGYRTLAQV